MFSKSGGAQRHTLASFYRDIRDRKQPAICPSPRNQIDLERLLGLLQSTPVEQDRFVSPLIRKLGLERVVGKRLGSIYETRPAIGRVN